MKTKRLRWKKYAAETGLRASFAGPRGSYYHDGLTQYATVSALGSGWYWVAGWNTGIPHHNSCGEPASTESEAKSQAEKYVAEELGKLIK